jgi:hypothetical protein
MDRWQTWTVLKPHGTKLTSLLRQWHRRPRLCGLAILALLVLALPNTPQANATVVSVYRYSFYEACFIATIESITESARQTTAKLKLEHKQSSGRCGCKSALLKVLVFVDAIKQGGDGAALANKRLVQTSPAFPSTRSFHDVAIPKRADRLPENYTIWLTCAS